MLKPLSRVLLVALVFGASMLGSAPSSAAAALAARSSDEAGVQVVVTPKALGQDVAVWEFNVVMDTHTKPLIAWQGDPPGGHHRKGVLQFSSPSQMPKSVELQIKGVGGVATRTFRWEFE